MTSSPTSIHIICDNFSFTLHLVKKSLCAKAKKVVLRTVKKA